MVLETFKGRGTNHHVPQITSGKRLRLLVSYRSPRCKHTNLGSQVHTKCDFVFQYEASVARSPHNSRVPIGTGRSSSTTLAVVAIRNKKTTQSRAGQFIKNMPTLKSKLRHVSSAWYHKNLDGIVLLKLYRALKVTFRMFFLRMFKYNWRQIERGCCLIQAIERFTERPS